DAQGSACARQPDPAEPDARVEVDRLAAGGREGVRGGHRRARCAGDHPGHPWTGDRRGLRSARREREVAWPAGDSGTTARQPLDRRDRAPSGHVSHIFIFRQGSATALRVRHRPQTLRTSPRSFWVGRSVTTRAVAPCPGPHRSRAGPRLFLVASRRNSVSITKKVTQRATVLVVGQALYTLRVHSPVRSVMSRKTCDIFIY